MDVEAVISFAQGWVCLKMLDSVFGFLILVTFVLVLEGLAVVQGGF